MGRTGPDICKPAMFPASQISVPHQGHGIAIEANNAVNDIPPTFYQSKDDIAHFQGFGLHEHDTVLATHDKGKHAPAVHRERDRNALAHQADGLLHYAFVANHRAHPQSFRGKAVQRLRPANIPSTTREHSRPRHFRYSAVRRQLSVPSVCPKYWGPGPHRP